MAKIIGAFVETSSAKATFTSQLIAKKGWLSSKWNLYELSFGNAPNEPGIGACTKKETNLSLEEVFQKMSKSEENPQQVRLHTSIEDLNSNKIVRKSGSIVNSKGETVGDYSQMIPANNHRYWRNVKAKLESGL